MNQGKTKNVFYVKKKSKKRASRKPASLLRFPLVPASMNVRLRGRTYDSGTGPSSPVYLRYGALEFLNLGGNYVDTFLNGGLYRYAVVKASQIRLTLVSLGTEPLILGIAPLPHNFTTLSPTVAEVLDHPKAVKKATGAGSGMDRVTLVNSATAKQLLGDTWQVAKYQMDYTQATSSTPIVSTEPAWIVVVSAFNSSSTVTYRLEVEMEWDVTFYNLDDY